MKVRTKLQYEVMQLKDNLSSHPYNKEWMHKECIEHKGFASKTRVICMDCGNRFSVKLVKRKRAICPYCKAKLKIENTLKRTYKQRIYFAVAEVYGRFQIIRNFEIQTYHKDNQKATIICREVLQHWILENGKREVISLNHSVNWYYDSWNGNMEIRNKRLVEKYDIYPFKIYPKSKFKDIYRMYGINHTLKGLTPLEAIEIIPKNPKAETLLKAKQYCLLQSYSRMSYNRDYVRQYWSSIKICMRNNYKVKDLSLWLDYMALLCFFQRDLRNAKYVCPKNMKVEHNKLSDKKLKVLAKQEEKRKRIKAVEDEKTFRKLKGKYFGITFSDGLIDVKVLDSVQEYIHEGDKLRHCVFSNEYYLKKDSLVLSARIKGNPIETVEISLKDFSIIQSRGLQNNNSEYHERILNLVKRNRFRFDKSIKRNKQIIQHHSIMAAI